ncbi:MAG: metal-sensing transcriptional repressor [Paenibacillus sp.]|nr:metal-sensing transcriptional repressor [Paenibacillus sp.]
MHRYRSCNEVYISVLPIQKRSPFSLNCNSHSDRECGESLIQIAAIRFALDNVGKLILKDHLEGCLVAFVKEK